MRRYIWTLSFGILFNVLISAQTNQGIHKAFQEAAKRHIEVNLAVGISLTAPSGVDVGRGQVVTLFMDPKAAGSSRLILNGMESRIEKTDPKNRLMLLRYTNIVTKNNLPSVLIRDPVVGEQVLAIEVLGYNVSIGEGVVRQVEPNQIHLDQISTQGVDTAHYTGVGIFSRDGALVGLVSGQEKNTPGHGAHTLAIRGSVIRKFLESGIQVFQNNPETPRLAKRIFFARRFL